MYQLTLFDKSGQEIKTVGPSGSKIVLWLQATGVKYASYEFTPVHERYHYQEPKYVDAGPWRDHREPD